MDDVYKWLEDIHKKYPSFDVSKWIPPSQRNRKDATGTEYRNFKWSSATKTLWYEMKLTPNDRWSGPYHGRQQKEFDKMVIVP